MGKTQEHWTVEDFKKYQDPEVFEKWLGEYIYLEKEANE